jgi:hypothetical protein
LLAAHTPARTIASSVMSGFWSLWGGHAAAATATVTADASSASVVDPLASVTLGEAAEAELMGALLGSDAEPAAAEGGVSGEVGLQHQERRDSVDSADTDDALSHAGRHAAPGTLEASSDDSVIVGWGPGQREPRPGEAAFLLHPLLRHQYRPDGRVEGSGCLYELTRFLRLELHVDAGRIRLSRDLRSSDSSPAAAPLPPRPGLRIAGPKPTSSRSWGAPRRALMERVRSLSALGLLQSVEQRSVPLLDVTWQGLNVGVDMGGVELVAVHARAYDASKKMRYSHLRVILARDPALHASSNSSSRRGEDSRRTASSSGTPVATSRPPILVSVSGGDHASVLMAEHVNRNAAARVRQVAPGSPMRVNIALQVRATSRF